MKEVHLFSEEALVLDKFHDINSLIFFSVQFGFKNVFFHYIIILVHQASIINY